MVRQLSTQLAVILAGRYPAQAPNTDRRPSRVPSPRPRPSQSRGWRDATPESCHRGDLLGLLRCVSAFSLFFVRTKLW
ncbi:Hypothetical protein SMAX5B_011242 [Scophthalmus maximus]|uniref:Uncharacterized protein n=1 Tax=Scophthalmus maximus TaxID=52904 RepID=A0A2U9BHK0_SCOMX|nr:Hypothetical protein SMAX5B_011242 [Scophthalmus maximus]